MVEYIQLPDDRKVKRSVKEIRQNLLNVKRSARSNSVEPEGYEALVDRIQTILYAYEPPTYEQKFAGYDPAKVADEYEVLVGQLVEMASEFYAAWAKEYAMKKMVNVLNAEGFNDWTLTFVIFEKEYRQWWARNIELSRLRWDTRSGFSNYRNLFNQVSNWVPEQISMGTGKDGGEYGPPESGGFHSDERPAEAHCHPLLAEAFYSAAIKAADEAMAQILQIVNSTVQ